MTAFDYEGPPSQVDENTPSGKGIWRTWFEGLRNWVKRSVGGWDDLRYPAEEINPTGGANDPDRDTSTGLLLFDNIVQEIVVQFVQMPHTWEEGTEISPHIHWAKSTSASGDVVWQIRYKHWGIGDVLDSNWTTLTNEGLATATTDNDTANEHLITGFSNIDMTGKTISDCLLMEISRTPGDANDTYGADAILMEFDVHYKKNSNGSQSEFVKD